MFVLVDARKHVIDIFFELPLGLILLFNLDPQLLVLNDESLHLHPQISHNQLKVRLDPREVFNLLAHLSGLLFKRPRSLSIRLDVLLKLFNLVIQNKLKLLQLLSLQFQLSNPTVLIFNGGFPLTQLTPLASNRILMRL